VSLWRDVLQKVKALGYTGLSFYIDWALLEGETGTIRTDGLFALQPFFDAALETGLYLLARLVPYINAEVSGGGFPGWMQRIPAVLRSNDSHFLDTTDLYMKTAGRIIAEAQITNGGPIILVQPENEYTASEGSVVFPNGEHFAYIERQLRDAGVKVPLINDASPRGYFAPGNGTGSVDIYRHDSYPLGFGCSSPLEWNDESVHADTRELHDRQSPSTPYSLIEFQGGSFDAWGGSGLSKCLSRFNPAFQRVFYKNNFSFLVTIFNQHMVFGGTNW
jgi:Glycosyl hydrolases family 35